MAGIRAGSGSPPWEKEAQELKSDVLLAIQGYTRSRECQLAGSGQWAGSPGSENMAVQASQGHGSLNG